MSAHTTSPRLRSSSSDGVLLLILVLRILYVLLRFFLLVLRILLLILYLLCFCRLLVCWFLIIVSFRWFLFRCVAGCGEL
jgi:hypothetical protein